MNWVTFIFSSITWALCAFLRKMVGPTDIFNINTRDVQILMQVAS